MTELDSEYDAEALKKLREPFPAEQIGKLPKGGIMLDFIGHGFITQRFLDADLGWTWRPMAFDDRGLPQFDEFGGLWMYLTVGGVERPGYGDSGGKKGANAVKEAIGDALRNSGMRFGAGLELWCKGDPDTDHAVSRPAPQPRAAAPKPSGDPAADLKRGELRKLAAEKGWDLATVAKKYAESVQGGDLKTAPADEIEAFIVSVEAGVIKI